MRPYISIDLETTGLNPDTCQVLEMGAVFETGDMSTPVEELNTFSCLVKHNIIVGEPYALQMNHDILFEIATGNSDVPILTPLTLCTEFERWLYAIGWSEAKVVVGGKNVASFDLRFLEYIPGFGDRVQFAHRVVDPAMMYWLDSDKKIPDLKTCCERAHINSVVTHRAVDDARMVVELVRNYFHEI